MTNAQKTTCSFCDRPRHIFFLLGDDSELRACGSCWDKVSFSVRRAVAAERAHIRELTHEMAESLLRGDMPGISYHKVGVQILHALRRKISNGQR